ncbi:hypothetical protein [Paraburkholderia sp. J10-1]|uniref:hypothetical protein n=1 Tax=Paraburkholderia sp. J10-1 TaxID=2805430 RepID=UPI002AB5DF5C|nr:hypothetical protein [Paraburkholderia sp. J10-1]
MPSKGRTNPLADLALARLTSARKESDARHARDLTRRQNAPTILQPNEVSGEYDAARLLTTTLHGEQRPLDHKDLRAFQQSVSRLKKSFKGGISAQQVIDLSLAVDRQRANDEIRMAVPVYIRGNLVHFVTNAGPESDRSRHHVHVSFLDFEAAVAASPNDKAKIGRLVCKGRLLFDCDCGRHTFWYRYIATIGKYNWGRAETGYPKIRNPRLYGVACKHVLRTMHVILKDKGAQLRIADSVLGMREVLDMRKLATTRLKATDVKEMAGAQLRKRKSTSNLKTSAQKQQDTALRKAREQMKKAANEAASGQAQKVAPATSPPAAKSARARTVKSVERHARSLLELGAITQEQYDTIVKGAA